MTRRSTGVVGWSSAVGVFLAVGVVPVVAAPLVRAEVVGDVIDEVLAPFVDTAGGGVDWDAVLTPAAWDAFFGPAHWDAVVAGLGTVVAGGPGVAAAAGASTFDLSEWLEHDVYTPLHAVIEDWINSPTGQQVGGVINELFGSHVIGDGAAGTASHPDGGAGGWLFGDGGAGWDSAEAGVAGGAGGAAGLFGN